MSDYIKPERYEALVAATDNNKSDIQAIISEYGIDVINKGYAIVDYNNTGMLEIQKIDILDAFEDDEKAAEQAMKDCIKIIPVDELPKDFPRKYLGWIDTDENRKRIADWTKINKLRDFLITNNMTFDQFIKTFTFVNDMAPEDISLYISAYEDGAFYGYQY